MFDLKEQLESSIKRLEKIIEDNEKEIKFNREELLRANRKLEDSCYLAAQQLKEWREKCQKQ